jgi:hypothetical protein
VHGLASLAVLGAEFQYAEQMLMTASIAIERAGGVLTAQVTGSAWRYHGFLTWHRRPRLDIDATAANGSV